MFCFLVVGFLLVAIGYFYYVPPIPVEVLNEKYEVKPSQYLNIDGLEVHYRIEGNFSDTVPVVLLHGTFSSLYTWNAWVEHLKNHHKIIRMDLAGFGLTGPHPTNDYSLGVYLEFLEEFLNELKINKCILAGNSLGGEIAWRYSLNHPEKVQKLNLIDAAGYPIKMKNLPLQEVPLSFIWLRIPWVRELSVKFSTPEVIRNSLKFLYGDTSAVSDDLVKLYFDMANRIGNREAITERMESFGKEAPYEKIPSIEIPTLILWGKKDRLIPVENAFKFHDDLPNSQLTVFPGAGHMPMEEIPQKSLEAVENFLTINK